MKIMKLASEMRDSFFAIIRANTAATVSEANDASLKIINTLIAETKETADEITRLRAALREILVWHDYSNDMHKPIEVRAAYMRARAALGGCDD